MVAESVPTRFTIDPARADEFIDDLSAVENSLRDVASKWGTTVGALSLFLATPEGLAIVAAAEIATAVHIRLQAQALLADVAQSMVYIVREYSREERRIPFNNDLKSIKLVEMRRANARRAGHLLFRLAHYNPAPIRSYTVNAPEHEPVPPVRRSSGATGVLDLVASDNSSSAAPSVAASTTTDVVAADSAQTCVMPKRPLGHGEANDISTSSAPAVAAATTANLVAVPLTISACACHNHLQLCEDDRGSSSLSIHARHSTGRAEPFTTTPDIPRSRTFHSGP